jgi:hypothetical protein
MKRNLSNGKKGEEEWERQERGILIKGKRNGEGKGGGILVKVKRNWGDKGEESC